MAASVDEEMASPLLRRAGDGGGGSEVVPAQSTASPQQPPAQRAAAADSRRQSAGALDASGASPGGGAQGAARKRAPRVQSVDVARGVTMVVMIGVDNQGDFSHVWWTFRESNFATFLFLVGVSITLALGSKTRAARGAVACGVWSKVLLRGAKMFLIGAALNLWAANGDFATFSIMGVLQRIGICYTAAAAAYLALPVWAQRMAAAACLFLYACVYYLVAVPGHGCGAGVITPECNAGGYIDRALWGKHMHGPNLSEGLPSTLTAFVTTMLGVEFGRLLRAARADAAGDAAGDSRVGAAHGGARERMRLKAVLLGWGLYTAVLVALGAVLAGSGFVPVNKKVWSPSFVAVVGGVSGALLCACLAVVDVWPPGPLSADGDPRAALQWCCFQRGHDDKRGLSPRPLLALYRALLLPCRWLGRNPLVLFVGMVGVEIVGLDNVKLQGGETLWHWVYQRGFASWIEDPAAASSAVALAHLVFWTAVVWLMDRKRYYITL